MSSDSGAQKNRLTSGRPFYYYGRSLVIDFSQSRGRSSVG